ncbi:MAG: RluA family pseudouridine synthase [Coriobacteriales bacterium]|nr:RluA family pseudouridine synthase [Coriobacteriales bacterium]
MSDAPLEFVDAAGPTAKGPGHVTFVVTRETSAQEALRALLASRPATARVFNEGQFRGADGQALRPGDALAENGRVTLLLAPHHVVGPVSETAVIVLHQDPFLLAVDKPAGILVHSDGTDAETLTARVQGYLLRQGNAAVPQALHRLDVDTSGAVLFSLTDELQPAFDALFASDGQLRDGLRKRYYAVVTGTMPWSIGSWHMIDAPIARDRHDARRMRVGKTGKPSATKVRVLGSRNGHTLVEAELITGRRHQIRVHLAHLGHPIVGDVLYGKASRAGSLLLHAHEVKLTHPITGEQLTITSEPPWLW